MDRTLQAAAAKVVADLAENGGGTYEAGTLIPFAPTDGYAVGLGGARLPATAFDTQTAYWLLKAVSSEYEANYVGTWFDGGTVHVDAVRYLRDLNSAIVLAVAEGQTSFYDFGDRVVLYTDGLAS